jgi:murein DD-endopeptidase MepM/ murein hydrolase activator NlpD
VRYYTIVIAPDGKSGSERYDVSYRLVFALKILAIGLLIGCGYVLADYLQMRTLRENYLQAIHDERMMKGEARILMTGLDEVKTSLRKVREYSGKLAAIANLQTSSLVKRAGVATGPGSAPLSPTSASGAASPVFKTSIPENVSFDRLIFKPVFARLDSITFSSQSGVFEIQQVISRLSQQTTLLASIPSLAPLDGWITSAFGKRTSPFTGEPAIHKGLDVAAPLGTPIFSPADGVVLFAGQRAGFGNYILIAHGVGITTGYGHNAQNLVTAGQVLNRGDQVATVGQTGRATGPHLHYEVILNGRTVDPAKFILNIDQLGVAAH